MLATFLRFLTRTALDRVLRTVDNKIAAETDREALKTDLIKEHYRNRGDYMRAGGLFLMILFAVPLGFWFASVCVYSVFWCAGCAYPREWTVAALPGPVDEWAGLIIISIFGVVGVTRFKR